MNQQTSTIQKNMKLVPAVEKMKRSHKQCAVQQLEDWLLPVIDVNPSHGFWMQD
jgi:hypothetical protein